MFLPGEVEHVVGGDGGAHPGVCSSRRFVNFDEGDARGRADAADLDGVVAGCERHEQRRIARSRGGV